MEDSRIRLSHLYLCNANCICWSSNMTHHYLKTAFSAAFLCSLFSTECCIAGTGHAVCIEATPPLRMHLGNSFFETILNAVESCGPFAFPLTWQQKVMLCYGSSFSVLLQFAQFIWMVDVGASGKWSCVPRSRCRLVFTCLNSILLLFWHNLLLPDTVV